MAADDIKGTIEKIEALAHEPGFIYTLALILMRDLFLDPEEAADIDWHDRLSFQEITFLVGLLVKRPITLDTPTPKDLMERFESVYVLFEELHKECGKRVVAKPAHDLQHASSNESAEDKYRRVLGEITWPSGITQKLSRLRADQLLRLDEPAR